MKDDLKRINSAGIIKWNLSEIKELENTKTFDNVQHVP